MKIKSLAKKGKMGLKKNSPEIMIGAGIVTFGFCIYKACKATLSAEKKIDKYDDEVQLIIEDLDSAEIDEETAKKLQSEAKTRMVVGVVKSYVPVVGIGLVSLGCFLGSYNTMKKRNAALGIAYMGLNEAFKEYKQRVKEAVGDDQEKAIRYGLKEDKVKKTVTDENGNEKKVSEKITVLDKNMYSDYSFFFNEDSVYYTPNAEYNKHLLLKKQSFWNDKLIAEGTVLLNDVIDDLGFPKEMRTEAGCIVGWHYDPSGNGIGDNYIDFGIFESAVANQNFVNGYEPVILLDFNVDGPVFKHYKKRNPQNLPKIDENGIITNM